MIAASADRPSGSATLILPLLLLCSFILTLRASSEPEEFKPYPLGTLEFDYRYHDLNTEMAHIEVTRTIQGEIRIFRVNPAVGILWCRGESQETAVFDIVGEGTLHGIESDHIIDPFGNIDCRLEEAPFTVRVRIRGKTWWKPNELNCSDETLNISFEAVHNEDLRGTWRCTLSNGQVIEDVIEPQASGKDAATIYNTGLGPLSETIEFQIVDGMSFEQTISVGRSERKERIILHQPHPDYPGLTKPSMRYESPPSDPTKVYRAIIGPPLSQVPYGIPPRR